MKTDIPGFEIIPPKHSGLLDQFLMMGWKWHSPFGLFGQVTQLYGHTERETFLADKFLRFGKTWDRRTRISPVHHLWINTWRQRGVIEKLKQNARDKDATIETFYIDTRKHRSWLQSLALRLLFGYVRPEPAPWLDDDD